MKVTKRFVTPFLLRRTIFNYLSKWNAPQGPFILSTEFFLICGQIHFHSYLWNPNSDITSNYNQRYKYWNSLTEDIQIHVSFSISGANTVIFWPTCWDIPSCLFYYVWKTNAWADGDTFIPSHSSCVVHSCTPDRFNNGTKMWLFFTKITLNSHVTCCHLLFLQHAWDEATPTAKAENWGKLICCFICSRWKNNLCSLILLKVFFFPISSSYMMFVTV